MYTPFNTFIIQQGTTLTVRWVRPEITGRDDFYYNIFYSEDNRTFTQHNDSPYNKQDLLVDYSVSGLRLLTTYIVRVSPENGVSGRENIGSVRRRSCEVVGTTGDTREWIHQYHCWVYAVSTLQLSLNNVMWCLF